MGYISQDKQQNIQKYQYKGGTASITYTYVWSPLAQACLKLFPLWIAPNLITFIALLILIVVHIVFIYYGDDTENLPAWKCYMMGISILVYQTLDNIDGKQARRTKTSSPLGMIFDHGSDSITGVLLGYQMGIILCVRDPNVFMLLLCGFIGSTYFCAMWIQYCTGVFRLGRINAVDQGLPTYALICFLSPILKYSKHLPYFHWYDQLNYEIFYVLTVLLIFQLISINKNIHRDRIKKKREVIFMTLLPISTALSLLSIYLLGPERIYSKIYVYMIYIFMFMYARNMILMQLCSVTKQTYNVFNRGTNFFLIANFVFVIASRVANFNPQKYFAIVLIIQFCLFIQFVYSIFNQMANVLGIKVFRIPYSKDGKIIKPQ